MNRPTNIFRDPYRLSLGGVKAVASVGLSPVIADDRINQARRRRFDQAVDANTAVRKHIIRTKHAA